MSSLAQTPETNLSPANHSKPSPTHRAAELLAENVTRLMNSEDYRAALTFRSRFYKYSFSNVWLIYLQCPEASLVAGYRRWQELGRQVRKGEKSIAILAPLTRKETNPESGEEEHRVFGFKTASVFNISQTEGEPVPEFPRPQLLTHTPEGVTQATDTLKRFAESQGFPVQHLPFTNGALGSFSLTTRQISLREDLPPMQTLKTLIHELGHALMHQNNPQLREALHLCELEAESCAYLVCESLGLDTGQYSFPYLANWASDPSEVLPAAERACKAADKILAVFNSHPAMQ